MRKELRNRSSVMDNIPASFHLKALSSSELTQSSSTSVAPTESGEDLVESGAVLFVILCLLTVYAVVVAILIITITNNTGHEDSNQVCHQLVEVLLQIFLKCIYIFYFLVLTHGQGHYISVYIIYVSEN